MGVHIDTSELDRFAMDLTRAPGRMQRMAARDMREAAIKIKKGMQKEASGHRHLPRLPKFVSYEQIGDLAMGQPRIEYEIGFEARSTGYLDNIAAFGTSNNAPVMDHRAPMRREMPLLTEQLADDAQDAVLGGPE